MRGLIARRSSVNDAFLLPFTFCLLRLIGWHRVTAATAPWLTACNAFHREPAAAQRTMPANGFHRIRRACRLEAARRAEEQRQRRRDEPAIEPEREEQNVLGQIHVSASGAAAFKS